MNIEELSLEVPIIDATKQAVARVEEITGKTIDFIWVNSMPSHAKLKAARSFMEKHIVYVRKIKEEYINHIIVHECYHIYRFWSAEDKDRLVMSMQNTDRQAIKDKWEQALGKRALAMPPQIYDMWLAGFTSLFYNAVTDTRIELSMYKEHPELWNAQFKSLKNIESEIVRSLDKKIEKMTPPVMFTQTAAMNYVFLRRLEPIIGRNWKKHFKGKQDIISLGNKLLSYIEEEDKGLTQDIEILNKWAELLDLPIKWVDFEAVPPNYPSFEY